MKSHFSLLASGFLVASAIAGLTACGGSSSSNTSASKTDTSKTDTSTPGTPAGTNTLSKLFPKSTSVFGISIVGTQKTSDASILHAANIMAEYLDNNEDGIADNQAVVDQLKSKGATLLMGETEEEIQSLMDKIPEGGAYQDLYASEVEIGDNEKLTNGRFDGALEEVLHLITHVGFAGVYPAVFGEATGTVLGDAMDVARGGQFTTIPASYPAGAWYTYDDATCNYSCMATEYLYWSLTSILGAQDGAGRLQEIQHEWKLNTRELVQQRDTLVYALLTDPQYSLPSKLPNGDYTFKKFTISQGN